MEAKGMETANAPRAPTAYTVSGAAAGASSPGSAGGNDNAWWRWTHGKSGSVSSSSDGTAAGTVAYSYSPTPPITNSASSDAASSMPAWESVPRWQKRTTRTSFQSRDDGAAFGSPSLSSSLSPKFAVSTASSSIPSTNGSARIAASVVAKKKMVQTSIRTARDVTVKKRFSQPTVAGFHDFSLATPAKESRTPSSAVSHDLSSASEIKWTLGPGKRKVVKKDKKLSHGASLQQSRSALNGVSHRPIRTWLTDEHLSDDDVFNGLHVDVDMLEEKSARCYSPTSTASTISSSASEVSGVSSSGFAQTRFVKSCALAIIEDCYREQQCGQHTRKRKLEGRPKVDGAFETMAWTHGGLSKSPGGCGSSSSDEELCHRPSSSVSQCGDNKTGRDGDENLAQEELTRRMLLGHRTLGSSSSVDSADMLGLSPSLEAQGLPWNIRRRLPVKIGTADEIDKECPICQALYGIGDQILRLPCEHFFHASCVDEWMKFHTSCPLCRTNVLDTDVEEFIFKHKTTDNEAVKRTIRPHQSIGFRPVEPEVDQLQSHLASLAIGDESSDKCLVCPTPTRPQRK